MLSKRFPIALLLLILFCSRPTGRSPEKSKVLIPFGSQWSYLDTGTEPGTTWRLPTFDDRKWKSGPTPLGYGGKGEKITIDYGPDPRNKYITVYFRRRFQVKDPSRYPGYILKLRYDDGGIVYLNGKEVFRVNLPEGEVSPRTLAEGGSGEDRIFLPDTLFKKGENLLAVEIHQSSPESSDLIFDLQLNSATKGPILTRKPPYLIYPGKTGEMQILWQTRETASCRLQWGEDTTFNGGDVMVMDTSTQHLYSYRFRGLIPGERYFYRLQIEDKAYVGSFYAAPPETARSVQFIVYGDTRTSPQHHDRVAKAILSSLITNDGEATLLIGVGDLVGNGNSESNWDSQFFDPEYSSLQKMHATLPFQSCMGNHEKAGKLFQKYFPYPFVASRYWSFDYGPVHFVIFDQYVSEGEGLEKELAWFKKDLDTTKKPWKIVVLHEPGWSAGHHRNNRKVQTLLQPLFEQYRVALVFGGHNHYYSRAVVNGVQHITTGGGGAPLYDPEKNFPHVVTTRRSYHFCKVLVRGDSLIFSALTPEGEQIDSFRLSPGMRTRK